MTKVKICGITTKEAALAVREEGADFAGFVFYPPSPRFVTPQDAARLAGMLPARVKKVGLFVNPEDPVLQSVCETVSLDMIQLHGDESVNRVRAIRKKFGLPVIKAVPVMDEEDLKTAMAYERVADWILFDAKAISDLALPGGRGEAFDWTLLQGYPHRKPWMLAGGLHAGNLAGALTVLHPDAVDVSSGVEDWPGLKNPYLITEFIDIARDF